MRSSYDHPAYYHLSYSHGMGEEIRFIRSLLEKHLVPPPAKILEPACGTGRVLLPLLEAGYRGSGFDNNGNAIRYLKQRLQRKRSRARVFNADLADFVIPGGPFDAAVCTVDTFRHLLTEADAVNHLRCVARHLRKDGIYLLALHLLPRNGYSSQISRWRDRQGKLDLHTTITVLDVNRRQRTETLSIVYNVQTEHSRKKFRYVYRLRTYSLRQFNALMNKVPAFEIAAAYTYYAFDAGAPLQPDTGTEDVLLVLRQVQHVIPVVPGRTSR